MEQRKVSLGHVQNPVRISFIIDAEELGLLVNTLIEARECLLVEDVGLHFQAGRCLMLLVRAFAEHKCSGQPKANKFDVTCYK